MKKYIGRIKDRALLAFYRRRVANGSVPTVGVTGSVGKTTTCRMIAHILNECGAVVGLSTTQGVWIGRHRLRRGDSSPRHGLQVISRPSATVGIMEMARGSLIKHGMILKSIDVGVLLNIHDNHLGLAGIESRRDMARLKGIVIERSRRLAILNADDELCLSVLSRAGARVALVSMTADNERVVAHREGGGVAADLDNENRVPILRFWEGNRLIGSIGASDIPATWGGIYRPAISNALFAIATTNALGINFSSARSAISSFHSNIDTNPGRMNRFEGLPYDVWITWADGQPAMQELANFFQHMSPNGKKRIVIAAMGNRPDSYVKGMAAAVSEGFSEFICTDWEDLRGRQPMEVANLLAAGLRERGVDQRRIMIAKDHESAVEMAFSQSSSDDLLVIVTMSGEKALGRAMKKAKSL